MISFPTLFEWAQSPIVYYTSDKWARIYEQAKPYFSSKAALYHYYGTARKTIDQYLQQENIFYKKYFYALRPLLAARYIAEHQKPAPVDFSVLVKQGLPQELLTAIDQILQIKRQSDEKELNPQNPVIQKFLKMELEKCKQIAESMADDRKKD